MDIPEELENFYTAFSSNTSGFRHDCSCGITYYDNSENGWDIEEGEIEALEANLDAEPVFGSVGYLVFEGVEYVDVCTCWHERALKIVGFIDSHGHSIAKYINLQKKTALAEANAMPEVDCE